MRLKYELRIVDALSGLLSDAGSIPAASIPPRSRLFLSVPQKFAKGLYLWKLFFPKRLHVLFDSCKFPNKTW